MSCHPLDPEERERAKRRIARLEKRRHRLSLDRWAGLLLILLPDEYAEPDTPENPGPAKLSRDQRMELMSERIQAGESPFHPDDPWLFDDGSDYPGGFQIRHGRNGADDYSGEEVARG